MKPLLIKSWLVGPMLGCQSLSPPVWQGSHCTQFPFPIRIIGSKVLRFLRGVVTSPVVLRAQLLLCQSITRQPRGEEGNYLGKPIGVLQESVSDPISNHGMVPMATVHGN